jgi:hypothetical protein
MAEAGLVNRPTSALPQKPWRFQDSIMFCVAFRKFQKVPYGFRHVFELMCFGQLQIGIIMCRTISKMLRICFGMVPVGFAKFQMVLETFQEDCRTSQEASEGTTKCLTASEQKHNNFKTHMGVI